MLSGQILAKEISQVCGYYEFGGTPIVLDPEISRNQFVHLTSLHEQTHRDHINNTMYGYLLFRLNDLTYNEAICEGKRESFEKAIELLCTQAWNCLEGAAVSSEVIVALHESGHYKALEYVKSLPENYKNALGIYGFIIDRVDKATDDPYLFLLMALLINAIAEYTLESPFLRDSKPQTDFWHLLDSGCLSKYSPDKHLRRNGTEIRKRGKTISA